MDFGILCWLVGDLSLCLEDPLTSASPTSVKNGSRPRPLYMYGCVHTYAICVCANIYSMYMYLYMYMSLYVYVSSAVEVVGVGGRGWRGVTPHTIWGGGGA